MIRLYQFEQSPFCDKVRRILHVKGQPYEAETVPVSQALTRVKRLNPAGKLPCIEHKGRMIRDSTDIAHHLEEAFPDPPLIPEDPKDRALCHMIEDWADESLYFYQARLRFTFPHNARRTLPDLLTSTLRVRERLASLALPSSFKAQLHQQGLGRKPDAKVIRDLRRHLDALQGWLGDNTWLAGPTLSLADIAVFAQLDCILQTDEGDRLLEARRPLHDYLQRVDAATSPPQ